MYTLAEWINNNCTEVEPIAKEYGVIYDEEDETFYRNEKDIIDECKLGDEIYRCCMCMEDYNSKRLLIKHACQHLDGEI